MNPTFHTPHGVEEFRPRMGMSGEGHEPHIFAWDERGQPAFIHTEFSNFIRSGVLSGSAMGQWHQVMPETLGEIRPGFPTPRRTTFDEVKEQIEELTALVESLTNLVEEVRDSLGDAKVGIGAIHSLNNGKAQLNPPLFYGFQEFEDDVLVSIGELGVTGVGANESQAVKELQRTLWTIFNDMLETPGGQSTNIVRAIQRRIDNGTSG